jgi:hypothetical protein
MEKISRTEQRRRLRESWQQRIEEWRHSGLSQGEYCRRNQIKWHQFIYWKKRLIEKAVAAVTFVPVPIRRLKPPEPKASGSVLKLIVGDRFKVEITPGFDARLLGQVLLTLENLA